MQWQQVNRTQAEIAFGVCENRSGASILGNYPVCFTTTTGSNDGVQVVAPASGNLFTFAGFADADIADAASGALFQCYGYRASVRIFATGTSGTVDAGVVMGVGAGSNGVNSTGSLDTYGPVVSMESIPAATCSPGGYAKAFIRLL
jgi:hypothetical protein